MRGLLWPAAPDAAGVLVVHGLASRKENHADFAARVAGAGMAALALDLRGHGASDGELDGGAVDDVLAGLDELAVPGHASLGLRRSSMGGLLALHGARADARGCRQATGDDRVPWAATLALAGRTPPPVRLQIALGGGRRTLQHDPAVLAETVAFLAAHLGAGQLARARSAN